MTGLSLAAITAESLIMTGLAQVSKEIDRVVNRRLWLHIVLLVHFQHKAAIVDSSVFGVEASAVHFKRPIVADSPPTRIQRVEVVPPAKFELPIRGVVAVHLHPVVSGVPRHRTVIPVVLPRRKLRRPEVHVEVLGLRYVLLGGCVCDSAYFIAIERPGDILWRPLDLVDVPVSGWVEIGDVHLVLCLPSIDDIGCKRLSLYGWHKLDINFVPPFEAPRFHVIARPESEEGTDSAFLSTPLHSRCKPSILIGLKRGYLAAMVRLSDDWCYSDERNDCTR